MVKIVLFSLLMIFSTVAGAEWFLEQSEDGHWITTHDSQNNQFIVATKGTELQYLLILNVPEQMGWVPDSIRIIIDRDEGVRTPLELIKQRPGKMAFRLGLSAEAKRSYLQQMVAGLKLKLHFSGKRNQTDSLRFSLLGFTDVYHDWLIANELGRLDPFWLHSHGKDRELNCYYSAQFSIKALEARRKGKTEKETLNSLARIGIVSVDELLPDIVAWAYALPENQLPNLPMSMKYHLFRDCIDRGKSEE